MTSIKHDSRVNSIDHGIADMSEVSSFPLRAWRVSESGEGELYTISHELVPDYRDIELSQDASGVVIARTISTGETWSWEAESGRWVRQEAVRPRLSEAGTVEALAQSYLDREDEDYTWVDPEDIKRLARAVLSK